MRRRGLVALLVLSVSAIVVASPPLRERQTPRVSFPASADVVWITATVTGRDGSLLAGLGAADFDVLVDGAPRPITVFRNDIVPFAVSIMFDTSGSLRSGLATSRPAVAELIRRFGPGDRASIGTFASLPYVSPRFTANQSTLLGWVSTTIVGASVPCMGAWMNATSAARQMSTGGSAIWDGIMCGINTVASDAETPRRVVIVVTDGQDNMSDSTSADVVAEAKRHGVLVYVIAMVGQGGLSASELRGIAEATGGGYHKLTTRDDLPAVFGAIADQLRHQYIFGVEPVTGDTSGEHATSVRVHRDGATVQSRRGYMTTTPVNADVQAARQRVLDSSASAPAGSGSAQTTPELAGSQFWEGRVERYMRAATTESDVAPVVEEQLASLARTIKRTGPLWIAAAGPAETARRRFALAAFLLEFLVYQGDMQLWKRGEPASNLLELACEFVRGTPVRPEELWWAFASVALLERFGAADALMAHLDHLRERFPDQPRWILVRAIAEDMRTWPEARGERFKPDADTISRVIARYTEAAASEANRAEARLRLGYFEWRRGNTAEALAQYDQADTPVDPYVAYTLHLFRGRALESAGRLDDAIVAYRAALSITSAQSGILALGAALAAAHRGDEASALVRQRLIVTDEPIDPWTVYVAPDTRVWGRAMGNLRAAVRR